MAELTRYRVWHQSRLSCKKTTVKFLVTLLILASFPEVYMSQQQHRHPNFQRIQPYVQPRNIFHPNSTISTAVPTIGAMRNIAKFKDYYSVLHIPSPPLRTTMVTMPVSQHRFPISKRMPPILPVPQNYKFHLPPGGVLVQRSIPVSSQQKHFIQPNFPVAMLKKPEKCPGRKNIIDDISIIGILIALMTSFVGTYNMIVNSMTSNSTDIVSSFLDVILWIPTTIISLFNQGGDYVLLVGRFLNSLSFVNSVYDFKEGATSAAGESVGVIGFILAVIATFPDLLDAFVEYLYKMGNMGWLVYLIENYGCEVPGFLRWHGKSFYQLVNDVLVNLVSSKVPVERIAAKRQNLQIYG